MTQISIIFVCDTKYNLLVRSKTAAILYACHKVADISVYFAKMRVIVVNNNNIHIL